MRDAVYVQPAVGVHLVVAELLARARVEDLGAAAGERAQARVDQLYEHLLVGLAVLFGKVVDLNRSKPLDMQVGALLFDAAQQVQIVLPRQIGVEPVDDVHLG